MHPRTQRQILAHLTASGPSSWGTLLRAQDSSLPEFKAALDALESDGRIVISDGRAALAPASKGGAAGQRPAIGQACEACSGGGYAPDPALLARYEEVLKGRPGPDLGFDQGYINPADALTRAAFMHERGDLDGASILCVGDFDLMSIALALTGRPERLTILDIDTRVLDFARAAGERLGTRIEARPFDVRRELDADLAGRFDVFVCDPVETLPGITLYLSRGTTALRGLGSAAYFGLTTLEASRRKWFDVQGVLHRMGFAVTDARRNFSHYPDHDEVPSDARWRYKIVDALGAGGVQAPWYTASFVRVEAAVAPTPLVTGASALGRELYIDDEAWATPEPAL